MATQGRTPAADGLSMPAEWSPHRSSLVSWPCREKSWRGHIAAARVEYAEVIRAIQRFEPVHVLSSPETLIEARATLLEDSDLVQVDLDDSWIRDNGPIFVSSPSGDVAMADFRFNAWGLKSTYVKDDAVPEFLSRKLDIRCYRAPMVLEGGAISVDGEGTLLTTEQCLLNENRNPSLSRAEVEAGLMDYLGIKKVIWLGKGQANDITDGHVDGVAGFCAPGKVMIARTPDEHDPNYGSLEENWERLETETDARGRSLEILDIVQPKPREYEGLVITPGYINHYLVNGGVIAPRFGIPEDSPAIDTLRSAYPGRDVVSVSAGHLEIGGGGIHCITQQIPDGRFLNRLRD
jgi:agmatine deiminase